MRLERPAQARAIPLLILSLSLHLCCVQSCSPREGGSGVEDAHTAAGTRKASGDLISKGPLRPATDRCVPALNSPLGYMRYG